MITFLELANMVGATQLMGWGGGVIEVPTQLMVWAGMHLAHIGKMNLSRPSAATMETCKYITGAIGEVRRLLKQAIPDQLVTQKSKNKAEINSSLWTYIRRWQWRWEVGHTGDACMKATGKKLPLMAHLENVAVSMHEATQKCRKGVF